MNLDIRMRKSSAEVVRGYALIVASATKTKVAVLLDRFAMDLER